MSDAILQRIERDEWLRLWNLIFFAKINGFVTLLYTSIELGCLQWLLHCQFVMKYCKDSPRGN